MEEMASGSWSLSVAFDSPYKSLRNPSACQGTAMSRHTRSKRNRQSRSAQGRRRVVGWGTSAGAVLAFGLGPWGVAPAAHADEFEVILEPIVNALSGVDPLLGADVST